MSANYCPIWKEVIQTVERWSSWKGQSANNDAFRKLDCWWHNSSTTNYISHLFVIVIRRRFASPVSRRMLLPRPFSAFPAIGICWTKKYWIDTHSILHFTSENPKTNYYLDTKKLDHAFYWMAIKVYDLKRQPNIMWTLHWRRCSAKFRTRARTKPVGHVPNVILSFFPSTPLTPACVSATITVMTFCPLITYHLVIWVWKVVLTVLKV